MMRCTRSGFTLLELMVVMAIITLLASVAIPTMSTYIDQQTSNETADRMAFIDVAVQAYARDLLALPGSLDDLESSGNANWRGPYAPRYMSGWTGEVSDFREDNWGRAFKWSLTDATLATLRSAGPDGVIGNDDDLVKDVDIRPLLREITIERLRIVNTAIVTFNQNASPSESLQGTTQEVIQEVLDADLLPASQDWTIDAFGDTLVTVGDPVTSVYSINVLNGYGGTSSGGGSSFGNETGNGTGNASGNATGNANGNGNGNSSGNGNGNGNGN